MTVSWLHSDRGIDGDGLRLYAGLRVGYRRLRVGTGLAVAVSLGVGAGLAVADVLRCLTLAVAGLISALLIGTCLVGTRLISGIGVRVIGALLVAGLGCLLLIGLLPRGLFLCGLLPRGLFLCGLLPRGLLLRRRLILAVVAAARVLVVGRVLILAVTVVRFVRVLRCRHDRPLAFGMQSLAICLYPQLIRAPFDEEDRLSSWKQTRSDGSACAVGQQRDAPLNGKSPAGFDNVEIVSLRPGGEGIRRAGHRLDRDRLPGPIRFEVVAGAHLPGSESRPHADGDLAVVDASQPRSRPTVASAPGRGVGIVEDRSADRAQPPEVLADDAGGAIDGVVGR